MHTGLAVITGTEDRQHAYVALTRGTDVNTAYVFTLSPKLADPVPGPRPAPELARYDRLTAAPGGQPAQPRNGGGPRRAGRRAGPRRPAALRHPDPEPGPVRRRPPGPPARDLGRRDHPRPRPALPATCSLHALPPGYRTPARPPGQMAVAHPARRRTRRAGRRGRSWPTRSASGTWPEPATSPPSSTPASATASAPWSRSRPARGPRSSPPSPTPNAAPTPPRSPR